MTAIIGPDWASIDKNYTPNLLAARNAGARFAIMRGVYGRGGPGGMAWLDPVWERDSERVVAAGLKRGAYLFLCYPIAIPNAHTPAPEDQADAFANYVQLTSYHDLVPFVDCEEQSILSPDDYYDWTLRCVKRLRDRYGAWPGLYFSHRVWGEYFGNHHVGELIDCPPWIAKPWPRAEGQPVDLTGAPGTMPDVPPQWGVNNWWLFQYQGDALRWPGFNSTVDANRFRTTSLGARGAHIAWAQRRLGLVVTGSFDQVMLDAVKELQRTYGLLVDGIVGPDTLAVICWHA